MPIHTFKIGSIKRTIEGGHALRVVNKTGALSKRGTLVDAYSLLDYAVKTESPDSGDTFGIMYDNDVPDGDLCWVVFSGLADVLLEDGTACVAGNWARTSITQAGHADITETGPPGSGILNADRHFKEIGHCLQTITLGVDKLARCALHFN